jgi:hypothetical protein
LATNSSNRPQLAAIKYRKLPYMSFLIKKIQFHFYNPPSSKSY